MGAVFADLVRARCDEAAWSRLSRGLAQPGPWRRGAFLAAYAGAGRRLGAEPVLLTDAERSQLASEGGEAAAGAGLGPRVSVEGWPLSRLGRAALLQDALHELDPERHLELVDDVFYRGDNAEREALLATLSVLPQADRFVPLAVEACRTNVESVFSAIALDNPFAHLHFPAEAFNQMVLKALFIDLDVNRIVGLEARVTDELLRMVNGYGSERRAAGRDVPRGLPIIQAMVTPDSNPRSNQ